MVTCRERNSRRFHIRSDKAARAQKWRRETFTRMFSHVVVVVLLLVGGDGGWSNCCQRSDSVLPPPLLHLCICSTVHFDSQCCPISWFDKLRRLLLTSRWMVLPFFSRPFLDSSRLVGLFGSSSRPLLVGHDLGKLFRLCTKCDGPGCIFPGTLSLLLNFP